MTELNGTLLMAAAETAAVSLEEAIPALAASDADAACLLQTVNRQQNEARVGLLVRTT